MHVEVIASQSGDVFGHSVGPVKRAFTHVIIQFSCIAVEYMRCMASRFHI